MNQSKIAKIALLAACALTLMSTLATPAPVRAEEDVGPVYEPLVLLNMDFQIESREEISFHAEIFNWRMPDFWNGYKFVIGFFASDNTRINVSNISAQAIKDDVGYVLSSGTFYVDTSAHKIIGIHCSFPSEFENTEIVDRIILEGKLSESTPDSELIDGRKYNFPFDEYALNLYMILLHPTGGAIAPVSGSCRGTEGLEFQEGEFSLVDIPTDIDNTFSNMLETENLELVVHSVSLQFKTPYWTGFHFGMSWGLFFTTIVLSIIFSASNKDNIKRMSIHIILASTFLFWHTQTYFTQGIPTEVGDSIAHVILAFNPLLLLLSLVIVSAMLLYSLESKLELPILVPLMPLYTVFFISVFIIGVKGANANFIIHFLLIPLILLVLLALILYYGSRVVSNKQKQGKSNKQSKKARLEKYLTEKLRR